MNYYSQIPQQPGEILRPRKIKDLHASEKLCKKIGLKKVFYLKFLGIFCCLIFYNFGLVLVNVFVPELKRFNLDYWWISIILFLTSFLIMFPLLLFADKFPFNGILLVLFVSFQDLF